MCEVKSSSIPAEPGLYLCKCSEETNKNESGNVPYCEAIGVLLFAARVCRPDIEYAVNYLSQFLDAHNRTHYSALKQILRYLSGTCDLGRVFGNSGSSCEIRGYTDADYAGCLETRKSRSGFVFELNGGPILWSSQR
ncbi:secreted RxLR effector protein 161-like [Belonocnema kinseyi]|uniref:secreted RxLR effector protein 161-like n=1 Tax=Belonocnema kinseyi TaxID=2817044 RepID=UPI00143DF15D|nr:secreted RxLR effector protein 161-like [Belonocnema kinseyi]